MMDPFDCDQGAKLVSISYAAFEECLIKEGERGFEEKSGNGG